MCSSLPCRPFLGVWGLADAQNLQEVSVVAIEVRVSPPSPALPVSLAEGTAGTECSHTSLPWETGLAQKGFSKERAPVGLIWALQDGLSTTWLPSKTCWGDLRTWEQLAPLKAAVFSGIGVKQKPAPLKAELKPS